jgi:hypothetical protein
VKEVAAMELILLILAILSAAAAIQALRYNAWTQRLEKQILLTPKLQLSTNFPNTSLSVEIRNTSSRTTMVNVEICVYVKHRIRGVLLHKDIWTLYGKEDVDYLAPLEARVMETAKTQKQFESFEEFLVRHQIRSFMKTSSTKYPYAFQKSSFEPEILVSIRYRSAVPNAPWANSRTQYKLRPVIHVTRDLTYFSHWILCTSENELLLSASALNIA